MRKRAFTTDKTRRPALSRAIKSTSPDPPTDKDPLATTKKAPMDPSAHEDKEEASQFAGKETKARLAFSSKSLFHLPIANINREKNFEAIVDTVVVFNLHEAVHTNNTIPFGMHQINDYNHSVLVLTILRDVFKVIRVYTALPRRWSWRGAK